MCCFSGTVRFVEQTQIFARPLGGGRQLLVYAMRFASASDLAMVLPIPVPPSPADDAVEFVDLSGIPDFFEPLALLFPPDPPFRRAGNSTFAAPQPAALAVHQVGDFEASFVPRPADFSRLDRRFRLPAGFWDATPHTRDWGFCVFKLRATTPEASAERLPLSERLKRVFTRSAPPPSTAQVHPMAFTFPRRDPRSLFFPTLHVHDGRVHETARFDHVLYAQQEPGDGWERSTTSADTVEGPAKTYLDPSQPVWRRRLNGELPNQDTWVTS